ncbi:FecR domain-containing protein [Parabacteroides sp. PF5-6]|uniref:FecR family protein n=1 Tax=Parabacteroides sp. PF5-6 TaxID=1742403 RepID=UPI002405F322|nr:FecR domain-containing protein [Parabacteroides sp. PF5-6]
MEKYDEKYIEDLILGYFAQELTASQEEELLRWLQADPAHRAIFSRMSDGWATAHVPLFMANRRAALDGFFGQQDQVDHPGSKSRMFNFTFFRNVAAVFVALVMVGAFAYALGKGESRGELTAFMAAQQVCSEVATPLGATSKVQLPDGSRAWLNAGSCLTYTYNYARGIREVQLEGEAYFDVAPDKEHPFVVKSNNLDIKVLGTRFNVKSYANDEQVKIALVSGSVNVKVNQQEKEAMDFMLTPDRMLTFDKESNSVEIGAFRKRDVVAWTIGELTFDNQPFTQIAKDLERKFNVQIRIESERLRDDIFSGSFSSNYSLDQILREVDVERRYTWTTRKDEVIIRDK